MHLCLKHNYIIASRPYSQFPQRLPTSIFSWHGLIALFVLKFDMYKGSHRCIFKMCMKQYTCNYGNVHNVEQLLGLCLPQNVSNDPCFSTLLYYWLSQRSQDKISTSMVWLSLTLYNTNKTKYMNVMSEILKAGWLELQLVTDVLGMSPLAGNKTGFPLLTVVLITHTPRPSSHECKSNPKTLN